MKKKCLSLILALLLVLTLLSACTVPSAGEASAPDGAASAAPAEETGTGGRRTIPYSKMKYERPDTKAMKEEMLRLTEELKAAESFEDVLRIEEAFSEILEEFNTLYTLVQLATYHDATDEYHAEELLFLGDAAAEFSLLGSEFNAQLVQGAFAEDYRRHVGDYMFSAMENQLLLNSEAVVEYEKERLALDAAYNQALATLTITHEGKEYTMGDLWAVEDYDLYEQLMTAFCADNAPQFAEMYARMVELDKLTAEALGFDSAAEMYYLAYNRDYTPEDALQLCGMVKEYFGPISEQIIGASYEAGGVDMGDAFAALPSAMARVSPELEEAWDFMLKYGVYDWAPLPGKQSGIAFMTELPSYDTPFTYGYWEDDFYSATTLMHEFGHFYDGWLHWEKDAVDNLDIAETYSQGLELLMQPFFGEFIAAPNLGVEQHIDTFVTGSLMYQCLLEEFQLQLYEMETLNAEAISRLYYSLCEEYGFGGWDMDGSGADYTWFRVTHMFDSPFYTISYVTSALAALQIWFISRQDWEEGAAVYLNLIHQDQNRPFTALLENAGLQTVYEPAALEAIAAEVCEVYGLEVEYAPAGEGAALPKAA